MRTIVCVALPNLVAAESFKDQVEELKNKFEKTNNPLEQVAIGNKLKEIVQNESKKDYPHQSVKTVKSYGLAPRKFATDFFNNFQFVTELPDTIIKENQQLKFEKQQLVDEKQQLVLKQNGITEKQIADGVSDPAILQAINSVEGLGSGFSKIVPETEQDGLIHVYAVNANGVKKEIAQFKNQEQLMTFSQIQNALKGQISMSNINEFNNKFKKILDNHDLVKMINKWTVDNIIPDNLLVLFDNNAKAQFMNSGSNNNVLYECKADWAIILKMLYNVVYVFKNSPGGQKALGYDPEIVAKLKKLEELNNRLGTGSLASQIEELIAKLELENEEANGLDALMGSLPKEFEKVSDITKLTMQSFQIIMKEMIESTKQSASGPLEDLKKLTECMLGGIPQIKENKLPRDLLLKAYSIAAKYDTKLDSDKVIKKFEDLMPTKKEKDREDAYQNMFIELYS